MWALCPGQLPAGVVDGVGLGEDDLGDGEEGVAVLEEGLNDARQGLWGVEGSVVKEHDGPGLDLGGHPLGDLRSREVLPVQAVRVLYGFKSETTHAFLICLHKCTNTRNKIIANFDKLCYINIGFTQEQKV